MISLPCPSSLSRPYTDGSRAWLLRAGAASILVSLPAGVHLSLFLLPCIMKMRSSCEPRRSQMGLCVLLPLLTTNSLPGGGQFPLCYYNLFGFQVPHGIKNNLLRGWAWWCWHSDRDALSPCAFEGHPLWWGAVLLGRKGFVMGDGDWKIMSGLGRDSV